MSEECGGGFQLASVNDSQIKLSKAMIKLVERLTSMTTNGLLPWENFDNDVINDTHLMTEDDTFMITINKVDHGKLELRVWDEQRKLVSLWCTKHIDGGKEFERSHALYMAAEASSYVTRLIKLKMIEDDLGKGKDV